MTDYAKARIAEPTYKSNQEAEYAKIGALLIADEFGQPVVLTMYEPMAFYIPGGRYKPDFMHILENGEIVFVEVKGSKKQRGYVSSRQKLRAAAEVFHFFHWCMCIGGEVEVI